MTKLRKIIIVFIFIMTRFIVPIHALDTSLIIQYTYNQKAVEDLEVEVYYIAYAYNGTYEFTDQFKDYAIDLSHITSQSEWREIAITLSSYIIADGIKANYVGKSNSEGKVTFDQLETGLYLTLGNEILLGNTVVGFETFLTVLSEDSNSHIVKPKYSSYEIIPDEKNYKVVKQWKDKKSISKRSESVDVDIYKDNQLFESVILDAFNNWTYEWTHVGDGSQWNVVERNVDENYKVSIYKDDDVFVITNTLIDNNTHIPSTGDSTNVVLYITLMSLSGLVCIILALFLRKKDHD